MPNLSLDTDRSYAAASPRQVSSSLGIRMMIILDIDDTVLDHSGAEEDAATRFGREFADRITGYE